jgi:hypothetical protein
MFVSSFREFYQIARNRIILNCFSLGFISTGSGGDLGYYTLTYRVYKP